MYRANCLSRVLLNCFSRMSQEITLKENPLISSHSSTTCIRVSMIIAEGAN